MVGMASQALGGRTATWLARGCGQGLFSRFPNGGVRLHAHHIWQSQLSQIRTKLRALSVTRIRSYHSHGNLPLDRLPNLLHSNLWLGWKGHSFRDPDLLATGRILTPHFRQI